MGLLKRHSSRRFTMDCVAEEAGMSRSSLHKYFKNKSELMVYMMEKVMKPYKDHSERIVNSKMPVLKKLMAEAKTNIRAITENKKFFAAIYTVISKVYIQKMEGYEQERDNNLRCVFEIGLKEGLFGDFTLSDLLISYSGIISWFVKRRLAGESQRTATEDAKKAVEILTRGICARKI